MIQLRSTRTILRRIIRTRPEACPCSMRTTTDFIMGMFWYRGHFTATGNETGITLDGEAGVYGIYSVWLNGILLGTQSSGEQTFAFATSALRKGQDNVVSILVMNMGHNESFSPFSNGANTVKDPRGIRTAILQGSTSATLSWRIQGNRGGEQGRIKLVVRSTMAACTVNATVGT